LSSKRSGRSGGCIGGLKNRSLGELIKTILVRKLQNVMLIQVYITNRMSVFLACQFIGQILFSAHVGSQINLALQNRTLNLELFQYEISENSDEKRTVMVGLS
jgi:hypothetical protein